MAPVAPSRTVLITGCTAGGLGSALALAAAQRGYRVFATLRSPAKAAEALREHPQVTILPLDVTDEATIDAVVKAIERRNPDHGQEAGLAGLDVLVNNAGSGYTTPLLDADLSMARQVFETNVWGAMAVTQACASLLVRRKGLIVNISSCSGMLHAPWHGIYSASKAAFSNLSEVLRLELAPFGVGVMTVQMGLLRTDWWSKLPSINLPEDSRYLPVKDTIQAENVLSDPSLGEDPAIFAESLLDKIEARKIGKIYCAPFSRWINWMTSYLPSFWVDREALKGQGLERLDDRYSKEI